MTDDPNKDKKKKLAKHFSSPSANQVAPTNPPPPPNATHSSLQPVSGRQYGNNADTTEVHSPKADEHHNISRTTTKTTTENENFLGFNDKKTITTETINESHNANASSASADGKFTHNDGYEVTYGLTGSGPKTAKPTNGVSKHGNTTGSHNSRIGIKSEAVKDAIGISLTTAKDSPDFDIGADARSDAENLSKAVKHLQEILGKNGLLPDAAALILKDLNVDQLKIMVQNDYTAKKEGTITVNYTDHLGLAFNQSLANLPVTHANLEKLTHALENAGDAVKDLVTNVKAGGSLSQDQITTTVRKTLQKELAPSL